MKFLLSILSLLVGCVTVPQSKNWAQMFNDAQTWEETEEAYQEMQSNDYIRFLEQGLKVVGISHAVGSNPPTGEEREFVMFWAAERAMESWQEDPKNHAAKNRALVGMRRLMELERLGWKVGLHVKWLVNRIAELDGVPMPTNFPKNKKTWRFGQGGYGAYLLHTPNADLVHDIGFLKSGGGLGRMLASICAVTVVCRPYSDQDWTLSGIANQIAVTVWDNKGKAQRIQGLKPVKGWDEPTAEN